MVRLGQKGGMTGMAISGGSQRWRTGGQGAMPVGVSQSAGCVKEGRRRWNACAAFIGIQQSHQASVGQEEGMRGRWFGINGDRQVLTGRSGVYLGARLMNVRGSGESSREGGRQGRQTEKEGGRRKTVQERSETLTQVCGLGAPQGPRLGHQQGGRPAWAALCVRTSAHWLGEG